MISETHIPAPAVTLLRDIIEKMRHDGCGGLAGKAELLTGIEGVSSGPVRRICCGRGERAAQAGVAGRVAGLFLRRCATSPSRPTVSTARLAGSGTNASGVTAIETRATPKPPPKVFLKP